MSNSKNSANLKRQREFRQFLRERELESQYRRFSVLRGRRRKAVNVVVGGEERPLIAYKTKRRILFRDPKTLQVITSTARYKTLNQVPFHVVMRERDRKELLGIKLERGIFKPQFRRTDVRREIFAKTQQFVTARPLRASIGKLFLRIRFRGKDLSVVAEGGSRKNRLLTSVEERRKAFDEAFQGALSQINFSYETYEVLELRFFYKFPKDKQRLLFV